MAIPKSLRPIFAAASLILLVAAAASSQTSSSLCPNGVLRFGAPPFVKVDDPTIAYRHFATVLGERLHCRIEIKIATSIDAENDDLREKRIDFGQFRSTGYVIAHDLGLADAVVTRANAAGDGPFTSTASIVVKKSSGITSVAQLAGKRFSYSDYASDTGLLFPEYAFALAGLDPRKGIQPVFSMHHVDSFRFLKEGRVEGAEINDTIAAANAKDASYASAEYVTLWTSEPIPYNPIAVRSGLSPELKEAIRSALLRIDTNRIPAPDGWFWKPRLVSASDSDYDPFRRAMKAVDFNSGSLPGNFP